MFLKYCLYGIQFDSLSVKKLPKDLTLLDIEIETQTSQAHYNKMKLT